MRRALAILLVCACSATGGTISGLYGTAQEWSWEIMPFGDYTNCVLWHTYEYEWDASTNYLDASRSTNDGTQATANSRPTFVAAVGVTNSAHYDFDGTDDFVGVPDSDTLSFGDASTDSPFSLSAWVYMDDAAKFSVFEKGTGKTTAEYHLITGGGGATGRFQFGVFDGSDSVFMLDQAPAVNAGEWVHIAGTYSGSGAVSGLKVYTNGAICADNPITSGSYTAMHNTGADLSIGRDDALFSSTEYADGAISDPRIYAKELTAAEVAAIYDDTKLSHGVLGPNVLWLQFASDETPEYIDSTYYGNDGTQGTANAQATWVAASGVTNAHYDFDGTDDYITIPDDDSLEFGDGSTDSPFSVSAWVKMDDATVFRIASKTVSTSQRSWLLTFGGTDKISWLMYDDSGTTRIGRSDGPALTSHEGKWLLVTATYDGSSTAGGCTIYTNGAEQTSLSNVSGSYVAMHNNASDIVIGGITWVPDYADGAIADVRIYSKELSAAEVADLHADTVGSHP